MIGKRQIELLKIMGYTDTQEDGAILQHPLFLRDDSYVWSDDSFEYVLSKHDQRLIKATVNGCANTLLSKGNKI